MSSESLKETRPLEADALFDEALDIADTPKIGEIETIRPNGDVEIRREDMVGRKLLGGFGGTTPILAHGDKTPPADLYGLHQLEILKPPVVTLGEGEKLSRADYGLKTPTNLAGLRADLLKRLQAKPPRGVE